MACRSVTKAEALAWVSGILALSVWAAVSFVGAVGAQQELERFAERQPINLQPAASPDQRLWSTERVVAWRDTYDRESPTPLAVLRIPRIGLEVAVLEGTDEWTLNRAVGLIEDTAAPGAGGNTGIAGHRDGFFRGLKDIGADDVIEIETPSGIERYQVERTLIVGPDDVWVLDPTAEPAVTLVTCYPFYFVGPAPQRFIVRAVRIDTVAKARSPG
jgi:sortase A